MLNMPTITRQDFFPTLRVNSIKSIIKWSKDLSEVGGDLVLAPFLPPEALFASQITLLLQKSAAKLKNPLVY